MTTSIAGPWGARLTGDAEPPSRRRVLTETDRWTLRMLKAYYPEWIRPKDVQNIQPGAPSNFWTLRKLLSYGLIERRHGESERNFEYRLKRER